MQEFLICLSSRYENTQFTIENYCTFNNKFYQQKNGLPMGGPISPLLAEIFMPTFENKLFSSKNPLTKSIHFWARYVDDIICI